MQPQYEPRFELHQIVNAVLTAFLLTTGAFLYSVNNQLIISNEKIEVITRTLDALDKRSDSNRERLIILEHRALK